MFVLIEHFAYFLGKNISAGYYGVDLFFVISGFLITSILLRHNSGGFKRTYLHFIGRRTLRIFPIYYFLVIFLWIVNVADIKSYIIYLLTYTSNYGFLSFGWPHGPFVHLWSLSVEEQFYLFWPFLVLQLKSKQKVLAIIMILIVFLGYSQMIFNIVPEISKYNYWGTFPRMASLALGGLGSLIVENNMAPLKLLKNKMFELIMLLILIISLLIPFPEKVIILGLCSLYLVLKSVSGGFRFSKLDALLTNKRVIFIGSISYGIYLFHLPIAYFFTTYIFDPLWFKINFESLGILKKIEWHPWIIKFPLYSFLSILFAALSFRFIEHPILKLKNRLFPR